MTSWTPQTKSSTSWATVSQNVASWANTAKATINSFILREDGFYMLREDGGKIIREDSVAGATSWTNINKS